MAEAAVQAPTTANPPKYFCHKCSVSVDLSPELPELTCPKCESGFVEELTRDLQAEQSASENSPQRVFLGGPRLPTIFSSLFMPPGDDDPVYLHPRHDFDEDSDNEDEEEETLSDRLLTRGSRRRRRNRRRSGMSRHNIPWASAEPRGLFPRFIEDLLRDLTGGNNSQVPTLLPFLPPVFHGDPRDYAWGADGLDNAITQLLNQWESPGSPPASKEDIDNLPLVTITQEHIDSESQCSVCMEDFHLDGVVRSLPCQHLFHTDCINPWLSLHNTCPICRKTLGMPAAEAEETNVHESEVTDATDSNSTDSSDSDADSDSSNEELRDSAATASLSAADGGKDPLAVEPTESTADIPDCTLWDIQPDGSTRLSATHQLQRDDVRRSRSDSSSSEYSSL